MMYSFLLDMLFLDLMENATSDNYLYAHFIVCCFSLEKSIKIHFARRNWSMIKLFL